MRSRCWSDPADLNPIRPTSTGPRDGRLERCRHRPAGTARPIVAPTTCMPCSFGPLHSPRSRAGAQFNDPLRVTVTVRWIPPVPAAYGTWVARPARTTTCAPGGTAPNSTEGEVHPPRPTASLARARRGSRQPGGETPTPHRLSPFPEVRGL